MYIGTLPYGHPWKATIYDIADTLLGPVCLCTIKTPEMQKPPYSVEQTVSPVPTVPELYKIHSIIQTLIHRFWKIVCHIQWIQRLGIILILSLIVLTPLNLVQQRKCGLVASAHPP